MLTSVDCFENADFCAFWDAVESIHNRCWDDDFVLEMLLEHYHNGDSIENTAASMLEADNIGRAEAWMAIPSWA